MEKLYEYIMIKLINFKLFVSESKYDTDAMVEDFENIGECNIISYIDDDNDYDLFSMINKYKTL